MTHDEYVKTLKSSLAILLIKTVMAKLITKLPFLGFPYLSPVVQYLLAKLINFILNQTEMAIFLGYVDIRTNRQANDFIQAMKLNLEAQQSGDKDLIARAENALIEKFKAFVRVTN